MWVALWWAFGCPRAPETAPVTIETAAEPKGCVDRCLRDNMARAVSWEVIQADCERACNEQPPGPLQAAPSQNPE